MHSQQFVKKISEVSVSHSALARALIQSVISTFGCSSRPWAVGLEIFQDLFFEEYFGFSLPDPENVLQSGNKKWFRAKSAIISFCLGWRKSSVCFCVLRIVEVDCFPLLMYLWVLWARSVEWERKGKHWAELSTLPMLPLVSVVSCLNAGFWMPLGNAEASTCMLVFQKCGFYFLKWIVVPKKSFSFFKASSEKSNCMGWKWGDYSVCKESCTW